MNETADIRKQVDEIAWFHDYEVVSGIRTGGIYDPAIHLGRAMLPESLRGKSVLDIGAWDGYYSFECEARGASRVLATDSWAWEGRSPLQDHPVTGEPQFGSKRGFELARKLRGSSVEDSLVDIMDLDPEDVGTFDLVLFLGVLYHLRHPLLALEKVAAVTAPGGRCIIETVSDCLLTRYPAAAFYPGATQWGDDTNWWGINPACGIEMCKAAGFSRVEVVYHRGLAWRGARLAKAYVQGGRRDGKDLGLKSLRQGRIVFHAYR